MLGPSDSSVQEWVKVTWGKPHDSKRGNTLLKDNLRPNLTKILRFFKFFPWWGCFLASYCLCPPQCNLSCLASCLCMGFHDVDSLYEINLHAFLLTILLLYCMRPARTPSQKWSIAAPYIIRGCTASDSVAIS